MDKDTILILGVNGSPRNSATSAALDTALQAAASVDGVTVKKIDLAYKNIQCCRNCNTCIQRGLDYCPVLADDFKPEYYGLYRECDGIILASAIYYMTATGLIQNFLSRMRPLSKETRQGKFGSRMGASIAVGGMRNGGQDFCATVLNNMLHATGANVIGGGTQFYNGASIWSANQKKLQDDLGILEAQAVGKKLAYMCKVVRAGRQSLGDQVSEPNFLGFENQAALKEAYIKRGLV